MTTYRVVIDGHPEGFNKLMMDVEGEFDVSRLATVDLAGAPMVHIGGWLVSRDRIVAVVPENAKERQKAMVR